MTTSADTSRSSVESLFHFSCSYLLFGVGLMCCSVRLPMAAGLALFLTERQPVLHFPQSNGHRRDPANVDMMNSHTSSPSNKSDTTSATRGERNKRDWRAASVNWRQASVKIEGRI
jgi:hypothetical protein